MFKTVTLKSQLFLVAIIISMLLVAIGATGLRSTYASNQALNSVYQERVIPIKRLKIIGDRYAIGVGDSVNRVLNKISRPEEAQFTIDVAMSDVMSEWRKYLDGHQDRSDEEQQLIAEMQSQMITANTSITTIKTLLSSDDNAGLQVYMAETMYPVLEDLGQAVGRLIDLQLREVKGEYQTASATYKRQVRRSFLIISLSIMVVLLVNYLVAKGIVASLSNISERLRRIVSGKADLTQRLQVRRNDEVGEVSTRFNSFMNNLMTLVRRVQQSGSSVTSSATAIASTSKQLERTVTEFGSFTVEVGATAKQISDTSQELVDTVCDVSSLATNTADLATAGHHDLERMEEAMAQMEDAAAQISARLAVISEKAANITTVVTTITKIADQTNLLSLNASIEAEKAGEYGLGFAVVAREIRRLADQVAMATLDIDQMVKEMKSAVSAGVMEMDKFSDEVRRDVGDVKNIGGQLTVVIEQVQMLLPQFETVRTGVRAQADGATQISESMVQLTDAVEQTSKSIADSNQVVEQLNRSAAELQKEVSGFKVDAD
jgi:methyl-accepting chemotaxis protein WspA